VTSLATTLSLRQWSGFSNPIVAIGTDKDARLRPVNIFSAGRRNPRPRSIPKYRIVVSPQSRPIGAHRAAKVLASGVATANLSPAAATAETAVRRFDDSVRSRWTGNNPPRFDGAADFQDHGVAIDHGDVDGESHRTLSNFAGCAG
jgi:hypothetical protein